MAGVASYAEICALGGHGTGHRQIQIINFEDSCCFGADAHAICDEFVSGVVN